MNEYPTNQFTLNLDKVGLTQHVARGLQRVTFETMPDMLHDEMVVRLSAYVLSEHLAADTVEDSDWVPATWWDHLKDDTRTWARKKPCRVLTRWWTKRYPPKLKELTFTATWTRRATRPESQIRVRDNDRLGAVVYQEQVDHSLRWSDDPYPGAFDGT